MIQCSKMVDSQQSPVQPSMTRFPSVIASSATARPRSKLQYGTNPFGFEAKSAFDAGRDLTQFRSVLVRLSPPPSVDDPWRRPPPDFRPQVYEPRPPKRNTRDAMKPWRYADFGSQTTSDTWRPSDSGDSRLPRIAAAARDVTRDVTFMTHFEIADPHEARAEFARTGINVPGPYAAPVPHDHRQLISVKNLGIPEFVTSSDPDPFGIHFHSQRLRAIHGLASTEGLRSITGLQMAPALKQPPKYESRLILPRRPWPTRPGSYTRFRRTGRAPHSALMERIDEVLTAKWAKEKLEEQLTARRKLAEIPER